MATTQDVPESPQQSSSPVRGRRSTSRRRGSADLSSSFDSGRQLPGSPGPGSQSRKAGKSRANEPRAAALHVVGSIVGCSGFGDSCNFARWTCEADVHSGWTREAGSHKGETQPSQPYETESDFCVWEHPIDLHFKRGPSGHQQRQFLTFVLEIYHRSASILRNELCAYATCKLPITPGLHSFSCRAWRPFDENSVQSDMFNGFWTGLYPRCLNSSPEELLGRGGWDSSAIRTQGVGFVHFRLFVVTQHNDKVPFDPEGSIAESKMRQSGESIKETDNGPSSTSPSVRSSRDLKSPAAGSRSRGRITKLPSLTGSDDHAPSPGSSVSRQGRRRRGSRMLARNTDDGAP